MTSRAGISKTLRYFISYTNPIILIELYDVRSAFSCQVSVSIQAQPNTLFGLLASPNMQANLSWLFAKCHCVNNIHVVNQNQIMRACMRYIATNIQHLNVVNYLIFPNQDRFAFPLYSHSYKTSFTPQHLIANVSGLKQDLGTIDMPKIFNYLRTSYNNTGRHIHDIQSLNIPKYSPGLI